MPNRKVVFFFPVFTSTEATAPLSLLAVSAPLLQAGYEVKIIDSTITPDFRKRVLEELADALCLGISCNTGPMIVETVEMAREAKRVYPEKPVILGGWHPSLLPEQTLAAPFVDVVVRGQGEETMLEAVERIEARETVEGVAGCGYKQDGELRFTPPRPLRPIRETLPVPYHLADFDAYERLCGRRWAMYTSSLACPYNCSYCTNAALYSRQWNALEPERVVEETDELASRYGLDLLWIVDDNFLVDLERAVAIGEGLARRNARFKWSIQATTNLVSRLSRDELRALRRGGLHQICMGVDSASEAVLRRMNKRFQNLDEIHGMTGRLLEAGIRPSFNIIFGYPGEGPQERRLTVEFITRTCRRYPGAEFWTNIFTPYPGAPFMNEVEKLGVRLPEAFEGWVDFFPKYTRLPWLDGAEHRRLQTMREYLRVAFTRVPVSADRSRPVQRAFRNLISRPARWRLDHDVFALPAELWAKDWLDRLFEPPKPAVDAKPLQGEPQAAAC